jgi:hypothetical protein
MSLEELFNVSKIIGNNFNIHSKQNDEYSEEDIADQMEIGELLS